MSSGTLNLQGTLSASSALAVTANGASAGTFALGKAAGNASVGSQTVSTLSLTSVGSTAGSEPILSFALNGTMNDSLNSTGALTLTGPTFELNLTGSSTGSNTLMTWLASGSTSLTTSNIDLYLNGTDLGTGSADLSIAMGTGSDDSLIFTAMSVPEPSSWAMLIMGLGSLVILSRRLQVRD